jgi:hypothetical protein
VCLFGRVHKLPTIFLGDMRALHFGGVLVVHCFPAARVAIHLVTLM